MCLLTRQKRPSTAKEPIVVYKIFRKENNSFYSPYRNVEKKRVLTENRFSYDKYVSENLAINKGIHACLNYNVAKKHANFLDTLCAPWKHCVFKYTIPKGTKYYKSYNGEEIVALKMVEIK